ncbi:uncharacterized protein LOC131853791 isoform X2 [Achroia grisella]|uniref:uncharacterized protein LOC131853791 isoform X2 n=1 Tax=Achroia grisella TaxID=688607 RepID=UPI0027D23705|nr:uncharacterized protein LOC131853791 isoform X2 [Achroia grisella]
MAINSLELCRKIHPKSSDSTNSSTRNSGNSVSNITKITTESGVSISSKCSKPMRNTNFKSPYLIGDKVQLLSRVTEKRFVHKKATDYVSSFPFAIYRANSDEINPLKRNTKKNKKSVLTLPNNKAHVPEICTVSEMNDSEYYNRDEENIKLTKKKRKPRVQKRQSQRKNNFEFYDRDARYCSQMNIDLDRSSSDILHKFNSDGKRLSEKCDIALKPAIDNECNAHDVWAVLRNINKFQFRPSPPLSDDSILQKKKKSINKKRNNRKDTRVVETCRTEEIAYISSFDVDSKSTTNYSPLSSCDRITVIDKQGDFTKICKEFEKRIVRAQNKTKCVNNTRNCGQIKTKKSHKKWSRTMKKFAEIDKQSVTKDTETKFLLVDNDIETCFNNLKQIDNQTQKEPVCIKKYLGADNAMSYNSDQVRLYLHAHKTNNSTTKTNKSRRDKSSEFIDSFVYSGNSGSSKAGLHNTISNKRDVKKSCKISSDESIEQSKAITKVVLNKTPDMVTAELYDVRNRKPRLVTTMPSTSINPKLTQTDIKRRLINLKYPIIILGKDQISTTPIHVENYEQFQGLDEHIWPFMVDWYSQNNVDVKKVNKLKYYHNDVECSLQRNNRYTRAKDSVNVTRKIDREDLLTKDNYIKDKKILDHSVCKNKMDYQPNATSTLTNNYSQQQAKKFKPMRQFKDKMLKLLYKKSSTQIVCNNNEQTGGQRNEKFYKHSNTCTDISIGKQIDASTETFIEYNSNKGFSIVSAVSSRSLCKIKRSINTRYTWAKGKWANDLIENVIKNITTGIYYTPENKYLVKNNCSDFKEASVQTISDALRIVSNNTINKEEKTSELLETTILESEIDCLEHIPGFDITLPALEIKTLNTKEIAVKHCVTNVMIKFDVTMLLEAESISLGVRKPLTCIPLTITDSHTRIYKCKTTILNAMLPAELCCIVPKLMHNITNTLLPFPSAVLDKTESHLSTITELTHCESHDIFKRKMPLSLNMSLKLKRLISGYFRPKTSLSKIIKVNNIILYELDMARELLGDASNVSSVLHIIQRPLRPEKYLNQITNSMSPKTNIIASPIADKSTCSALQMYKASKHSLIQNFVTYSFINILTDNESMNKFVLASHFLLKYMNQNIGINITNLNEEKRISFYFGVNHLKINSNSSGISKNNNKDLELDATTEYAPHRCIECSKPQEKNELSQKHAFCNKTKNRFVRLYRKCKSTSNISAERSTTSISKIVNLNNFFQALGSGKVLSGVFEGSASKKILSCVTEMKNWITEISQRQAMLVLLLVNKKDTPNLARFRPVLLQGIAVNRITRAVELDMEIEVIERENFNKLPQASDYQRPFDESSEHLLKSLLEKRKKLNPSYLRVMARYVGLGLLKSQNKKQI